MPVRKEVKQAWLNAAYAGINSLEEIGTRDDLAKLKEMYTPIYFTTFTPKKGMVQTSPEPW